MFNEIYGSYYSTVGNIITAAINGELDKSKLQEIVGREAFGESVVTIPDAVNGGAWPFIDKEYHTVIKNVPTRPETLIERRWIKTILSDPRVRLFGVSDEGYEDTEPLYGRNNFVFYDRYLDGDNYEDKWYISNFRTVLRAIKEKKWLLIRFYGSRGRKNSGMFIPCQLEYSSKDDKFRLITVNGDGTTVINLSRIVSCNIMQPYTEEEYHEPEIDTAEVTFEPTDERNALERVMYHFSHLEKETQKTGDNRYLVKLKYQKDDETEMIIRMLSFGPVVKVVSPKGFVRKLRERIEKQTAYGYM